jgi:hypothetical protein
MQTKKILLAFVAIAALVAMVTFPSASDVIAQTYDAKKGSDNSSTIDSKDPQYNSLIHLVSTEGSASTVDAEEDNDTGESVADLQGAENGGDQESEAENEYTRSFRAENCTFSSMGRNPFFILEPNYQLVLGGEDAGDAAQLTITVLNETREVNGTQTRVIEERESVGGDLVEISRNFFAICEETNNVFYFGEEVDIYENGMIVDHEGAWRAGEGTNRAGIIMPGTILLGARYYQEIAPSVALDRAEVVDMGEAIQTPSGDYSDTLITRETTPLEPDEAELKYYAAGIGLVQEEDLKLEQYGFIE